MILRLENCFHSNGLLFIAAVCYSEITDHRMRSLTTNQNRGIQESRVVKSFTGSSFRCKHCVECVPGVGPVMGRKLSGMGVKTCGDLQHASQSQLEKAFGPRTGQTLFRFCRGLDDRPVRYEKERKSVSAENELQHPLHRGSSCLF